MKVLLVLLLIWLLCGATAAVLSIGPALLRILLFGPISLANLL
jgi:hypothetical protein